jgi:hypothetical protein
MIPETAVATKGYLGALPKDDLQSRFRSWQDPWNKCIDSKGNYFEGD